MKREMKVFVSSRSFGSRCPEAVEAIEQVAVVERSTLGRPLSEDELVGVLPLYDGIIVGVDEVTRKAIESSERLKVVAKHGAGVDNIDLKAATERGVVVTYVPGANAESVADFTFSLTLALARNLIAAHSSTKAGNWESKRFVGSEIYKKCLGIVGMGTIGSRVAKRAKGFDMRILCLTAHPDRHREEAERYGVEFVDLPTLMRESDIVTIHCELNPKTKGMIGEKELALMKKSAFLINTARGAIIDERALYQTLKEKRIAGAALDVYAQEPPGAACPFFELDNVLVTPHLSSYTIDALSRVDLIQARDMVRVLQGERPEFVANPEVLEAVGRPR